MTHAKVILKTQYKNSQPLITVEVTFPRIILPQILQHRAFSRNSASSRARNITKVIENTTTDGYTPTYWGSNGTGMQPNGQVTPQTADKATITWEKAKIDAIHHAKTLEQLGVHKEITNRLVEPFMMHTMLITATEWDNFFQLRDHKDAQHEIRLLAQAIKTAITQALTNQSLHHLPYIDTTTPTPDDFLLSAAACARVSYDKPGHTTHTDLTFAQRLLESRHMSPFEHQATHSPGQHRNLIDWKSYREMLETH